MEWVNNKQKVILSQIYEGGNQQRKKLFHLGTAKVKNCSQRGRLNHSTKARREKYIFNKEFRFFGHDQQDFFATTEIRAKDSAREGVEMRVRCISWEGGGLQGCAPQHLKGKPPTFDKYSQYLSQTESVV